jgi:hypothetical protein
MANSFLISSSLIRRIVPPVSLHPKELQRGQRCFAEQFWPLRMKLASESDFWQLPVEALVTISGANSVIRRNVSKTGVSATARGTVKERWNRDDWRINISGLLYNVDDDMVYPADDVKRLRDYCEARQSLEVECELFTLFNITHIVIENYELPFTKGENRQQYSITAYSDEIFELLIDTESNV